MTAPSETPLVNDRSFTVEMDSAGFVDVVGAAFARSLETALTKSQKECARLAKERDGWENDHTYVAGLLQDKEAECERLRIQCQEEIRLRSEAVERTVAAENREREAFRRAEAICQQEGDEWASDAQITDKNYAHACRDRIAGIADERRIDAASAEEER